MTVCNAQISRSNPRIFTAKNFKYSNELNDNLRMIRNDNPDYSSIDFDDSRWSIVHPDTLRKNKSEAVVWFRYYFKVDSSLVDKPLCFRVNQMGASAIYLNGKILDTIGKIGRAGNRQYKVRNPVPNFFTIKDTAVHVLAIRFQPYIRNEEKTVNINSSQLRVRLVTAESYVQDEAETGKEVAFYVMLISGIFLALAFVHFLLFVFYRKALYNLYFSTYNLSIALLSYSGFLIYEMSDPLQMSSYTFYAFAALVVFGASLTGFINTLFGKSKIRLAIMLTLAGLLFIFYYFYQAPAIVFSLLYLVIVAIESFWLIIRAMIRREKSAFIVGGGILAFFAFIVLTIILNILDQLNFVISDKIADDDFAAYFLIFVFVSFPISISAYLAWQFASTNLNLVKQLDEVKRLSDLNLTQEQEKQQLLLDQNEMLENQVSERTLELRNEKQKTENLLLNILPFEVAEELKENGSSEAKYYDEVTVLFTDFVNFTQSSEKMGAEKMLFELNECFTAFDLIMEKHGLEKIKTIGDAYLAVCGLPLKTENHAYQTVLVALDILNFIEERKKTNADVLDIRIGVNSGSLIAGIVGVKKFAYDIWGDTVNTAARMEQNSESGKINISETTYQLVKDQIYCEYRGKIHTKGKGDMDMYFALKLK
ncbi:hypothetical protein ASG01_14140 [Chryseobacterium sp. Leaf180]|nr:hypothetical protein ASG01_14140 [Chryseobacterium sp. Leaf180]